MKSHCSLSMVHSSLKADLGRSLQTPMTTIPAQDGATLSDCPIRASAWHDSRGGPPRLSLACSELTQVAIHTSACWTRLLPHHPSFSHYHFLITTWAALPTPSFSGPEFNTRRGPDSEVLGLDISRSSPLRSAHAQQALRPMQPSRPQNPYHA
jgi:hypothetical protein